MAWFERIEDFYASFWKGYQYQFVAASQFMARGYWVRMDPVKLRQKGEPIIPGEYTKQDDLYVYHRSGAVVVVEVKSVSRKNGEFKEPGDFPFHRAFLQDWDSWPKKQRAHAYCIVSQVTGCIVVATNEVYKHAFKTELVYDSEHKKKVHKAAIPVGYLISFPEYLVKLGKEFGPP